MANEETIKLRIAGDSKRDIITALENLKENISFLNRNFNEAIRIFTDDRSKSDITNEIIIRINEFKDLNNII